MFHIYDTHDGKLQPVNEPLALVAEARWIDLLRPTPEDEEQINRWLGVEIPDREEMEEIEISSRLYIEGSTAFMTAIVPAFGDGDEPEMAPVTFVLTPSSLVTLRHHEPRVFALMSQRADRGLASAVDGEDVFVQLLEAIVDRLADVLERYGRDIETVAKTVFAKTDIQARSQTDFGKVLSDLGRQANALSNIRDSLVSLERLAAFATTLLLQRKSRKELRERLKTVARDIRSLSDHDGFLSQKINFLLDATLGMISIEQNGIIKIFSVAAVVFLPPTLVASIYGMNFEFMPELQWPYGYPFALGLMVVSMLLPYLYFKRRGWL
ncbi:MAG: magnesium/cobalt transporter CorA [Pseudomonadota bacterium]|jgi:magnesium transporter|uniref:magnesium/cobalt transporter CorA n=1 Tax=Blastomonas sp. CCH1-A6 TaxID=1768762 RepID=UPI000834F737